MAVSFLSFGGRQLLSQIVRIRRQLLVLSPEDAVKTTRETARCSQPLVGGKYRAAETFSEEATPMAHTSNDTKGQRMTPKAIFREEMDDFSLVLGGPVFQFFRKAHLTGDHLEFLYRRVIIITSIAWVPLLLLSSLGSQAASIGRLSFLHDVEVQVRFLVALPVLIWAELIVHSRIRPVVRRFVERRIVREEDLPRFEAAIEAAARLRNSIPVEMALLIFIYTLG